MQPSNNSWTDGGITVKRAINQSQPLIVKRWIQVLVPNDYDETSTESPRGPTVQTLSFLKTHNVAMSCRLNKNGWRGTSMTGSSFMSFVVAFKIWTDSQVDEANLINVRHIEPVNMQRCQKQSGKNYQLVFTHIWTISQTSSSPSSCFLQQSFRLLCKTKC